MTTEVVVIVSESDPVARAVAEEWGPLPPAEGHVDGAGVRMLRDGIVLVRRPGPHIHDEKVDLRLPKPLWEDRPTLIFPSIHKSERNVPCLTVHALGNPGPKAEFGGRPRTFVPADPLRMVSALRLLDEGAAAFGMNATYEATHHGPEVDLPAFFVEIGYGELPHPPREAVRLIAEVIPRIRSAAGEKVAMGVGGGHYAPHFTEVALRRRWALGHILSRHVLEGIDRATVVQSFERTTGAEGILFARAEDARHPAFREVAPRLREQDAPPRTEGEAGSSMDAARSASGT